MKCPVDNTVLQMMDRQGIEIDYCPTCRGVWLDRGELDKLIEQSNRPYIPPIHNDHRESRSDDRDYSRGRRKKESMLGDLFDF